jgi:hypothetical protein
VRLGHCQDEHFRVLVKCYSRDVVETWRVYDEHMADDLKNGNLFLTAVGDNPTSNSWYKNQNVGLHQISAWLKMMANAAKVEGKVTNKTGRRTAISRMSIANVPRDVMCQITGHKSQSSLDRYDDSLEVAREAAMRTLEAADAGLSQVDVQYSTLKSQVTKEYVDHHVVKVPSSSLAIISAQDLMTALKGKGAINEGFALVPYSTPEPEIAVYPYAPPSFYSKADHCGFSSSEVLDHHVVGPLFNDQSIPAIGSSEYVTTASASQPVVSSAEAFYSQNTFHAGCTSRNPPQVTHNPGFQSQYVPPAPLRSNEASGLPICFLACPIHCLRSREDMQSTVRVRDCNMSTKFVPRNPYGSKRKVGQIFKSVPPQYAKTPGRLLHEAQFTEGCSYGVE